VLRDEAPDILDEVLASGALRVPIDLGDGPHDAVVCSRRLPFDAVLWRAAGRQAGVTIRGGSGVDDFLFDRARTPRVRGVHLEDGETLQAAVVVDAAGRRSPTPRFFARRGLRPLPEKGQDCGLLYISRYYRLARGADYPSTDLPIMVNLGWATAMAFPADRRTFCLLAIVASIDPLRKDLIMNEGFSRFQASIPLMAPWLHSGQPIAGIQTMAGVDNRYRRLVDDAGPIIDGLLLLGDAAMHTNPTAGRGVSLAFAHVQHLVSLTGSSPSSRDLAMNLDAWTETNVGAWFQLQAGTDASMLRRAEAAVRGEAPPPPDHIERIRAVAIELSKQSGPAGLLLRRMRQLVSLPAEVLTDLDVLAAAKDFLARPSPGNSLPAGPTRADFAAVAAKPVDAIRLRAEAGAVPA
jgi:2-polyprenyl-6-methoxyphenol hydroxylase-like FAD-dependent oxidoreductase